MKTPWRSLYSRGLAFACCLSLAIVMASAERTSAQETLRISAVVNEDIISAFDLQTRLRLVILMSRLPRTEESIKSLAPGTLRTLIDEKLKLQEAKTLSISVSQSELDKAVSVIESRNNLGANTLISLLEKNTIDPESLYDQIRAEIVWPRIVTRKYGDRVTISDEDIDAAIAEEEIARSQPRHHVSELIITAENPESVAQANEQMMNLSAQLDAGADFGALARSFSQSPSAPGGGDIGWLRLDLIPTEVRSVIANLQPGHVSRPVRVTAGFAMFKLHEVITGPDKPQSETVLKLSQLHLPLAGDAPADTVSSYMTTAQNATGQLEGCADFDQEVKEIGSPLSGNMGTVTLSKMPTQLQDSIRDLPVGKASAPIRMPDAIVVLMVCERNDPSDSGTSVERDAIQKRLFAQRMDIYARQEIRELRRAAFIEIR